MKRALSLLALACAGLGLAACDEPTPFAIVAGSENTVLQPLVEAFCEQRNMACTFTYEGSLDIGLALGGQDGVAADAVWPASSVWIDLFDTRRTVKDATSIAQMPVILGVRKSKADELGWVGRDVHMKDILEAVRAGDLKFLMTSATQSNSGASAYLAMLTSALGGADTVIEAGDLDKPDVRDTVRTLLSGVERSSGSSGWLADLYVKSAAEGTRYDAMWNYEAILKETNDSLRGMGGDLLYAIYPADGVAIADSPLGFVDHGRGETVETFFTDLVAHLRSPDIIRQIAETGRRIPLAGEDIAARPEPDWNFDPTRLVTAIRKPEPAVIRQALDLYQGALRKPSLSALCLDFSRSMDGEGEGQLREAMRFLFTPEEAGKVLVQWSPADRILVFPFDTAVRVGLGGTGAVGDQAGLLGLLDRQRPDGGTDMYACAAEALYQIAETPNREAYLPAIVIMTDGKSNGDIESFMGYWRSINPRVPVFGITFGDADKSQLDAFAAATSGRVFDGAQDLVGAFRAARGYN
jgi:Ca-activated chloride channel family protein